MGHGSVGIGPGNVGVEHRNIKMAHSKFLAILGWGTGTPLSPRKVGIRNKNAGMEARNTPENGGRGHRKVGMARKASIGFRSVGMCYRTLG